MKRLQFGIKRAIDIVSAVIGLIVLSPVLGITALLIRIKLGSPVFFIHTRSGKHEAPFDLIKFRTMLDTRDVEGRLLPDDKRVSSFGLLVRKLSIDELPALINVLKGDMSLVGPRPLLMRYLPHYTSEQRQRFDVSPGITGLAQINGRNNLSWEEKFSYDIDYIENFSLLLDTVILLKTILVIFSRKGTTDGNRSIGQIPFDDPSRLKKLK